MSADIPFPKPRGALRSAVWGLLTLITGSITGNSADDLTQMVWDTYHGAPSKPPIETLQAELIVFVAAAFVTLLLGWRLARVVLSEVFLRTTARATPQGDQNARAYRGVVSTLSVLGVVNGRDTLAKGEALAVYVETALKNGQDRSSILNEICRADLPDTHPAYRLPWQQTLRVVSYHNSAIEIMRFILSPEASAQFPVFERIAKRLINPRARIVTSAAPVDLKDYSSVSSSIVNACQSTRDNLQGKASDICVDISAGNKVWSAAATIATLNSQAAFTYVNTIADGTEGKVVVYEAELVV